MVQGYLQKFLDLITMVFILFLIRNFCETINY